MVQHIERLHTGLELYTLGQVEGSAHRDVPLICREVAKTIAFEVALARGIERSRIRGWWSGERINVDRPATWVWRAIDIQRHAGDTVWANEEVRRCARHDVAVDVRSDVRRRGRTSG